MPGSSDDESVDSLDEWLKGGPSSKKAAAVSASVGNNDDDEDDSDLDSVDREIERMLREARKKSGREDAEGVVATTLSAKEKTIDEKNCAVANPPAAAPTAARASTRTSATPTEQARRGVAWHHKVDTMERRKRRRRARPGHNRQRPTKVPKTKSTKVHRAKKQPIKHLRPPDNSWEGEPSLLSLDGLPLVLVLVFLVDTPGGVDEAVSQHPPFRSVNRANELWERLCRSRWKNKFGYQERYDRAKALFDSSTLSSNASPEFWCKQYYKAEADAKRSTITIEELTSLAFSCRSWFDPIITPPNWKKRRRVWMSGLRYSTSDHVKFSLPASAPARTTGLITGHPGGVINWYWQKNGSNINIESPRPSKFRTLHVRRLPNWGWELASDVIVLRAVDQTEANAIDALWHDYTSILVDQPMPRDVELIVGSRYQDRWREIPNIPELMNRLPWEQWDDV